MESWQKSLINCNICKLVDNTLCHQIFLSLLNQTGVLDKSAIQMIQNVFETNEQAKFLYEHIQRIPNAFENLIGVLYQTDQLVSLKILLRGIPAKHFWNTKVKFLGKVSSLKDILNESEFEETKLSLLKILSPEEFLIVLQCPPHQTVSLIKNTIPSNLLNYLPRSLVTVRVLRKKSLNNTSDTYRIFTENELISLNYSSNLNNGICIYAAPETGKSSLLGNLARKMTERFPQTIVIFLPIIDFLRQFQKSANKIKSPSIRKILFEYISPSPLALSLLSYLLENRFVHIHLFIDGLDHLDESNLIKSQQILYAIQKTFEENASLRFYITLSENRNELINLLNLKQFKLKPLSKVDQVDFLLKYWKCQYKLGRIQESELEEFATFCIQQFQKVMKLGKDQEGSVVKLRLLAELYSERAYDYSQRFHDRIRSADSLMFPRTVLQLFTRFTEYKIREILESNQEDSETTKVNVHLDIEDMNKYLRLLALRKIFPDYIQNIDIPTLECDIKVNILDLGLDNLSISEHLVAEYFAKVITSSTYQVQSDMQASVALHYFYNIILEPQKDGVRELTLSTHIKLHSFKYARILYMIDAHLEEYRFSNSRNDFANIAKRIFLCIDPTKLKFPSTFYFLNRLHDIIQACVFHNFYNIFLLVTEILVALRNGNYRNEYLEDRKPYEIVLNACTFGSLKFVKDCLDLFIERCSFHVTKIFIRKNKLRSYTGLDIAINNLDYPLAKVIVDKIPALDLEKLGLVQECVQNSFKDPNKMVQRKLDILKLILNKNKKVVDELLKFPCSKLKETIHPDILGFLLEESDIDFNGNEFRYESKK